MHSLIYQKYKFVFLSKYKVAKYSANGEPHSTVIGLALIT